MRKLISITDENKERKGQEYINLDRVESVRIDRPLNSKNGYRINITTYSSDRVREYYFYSEEKRDEVYAKIVAAWKGEEGETIEIE